MNYQIMTEDQRNHEGNYIPNYDELLKNAKTEEEKECIERVRDYGISFRFNVVYVSSRKCGHYEVLQAPGISFDPDRLNRLSKETKCSQCTTGNH